MNEEVQYIELHDVIDKYCKLASEQDEYHVKVISKLRTLVDNDEYPNHISFEKFVSLPYGTSYVIFNWAVANKLIGLTSNTILDLSSVIRLIRKTYLPSNSRYNVVRPDIARLIARLINILRRFSIPTKINVGERDAYGYSLAMLFSGVDCFDVYFQIGNENKNNESELIT